MINLLLPHLLQSVAILAVLFVAVYAAISGSCYLLARAWQRWGPSRLSAARDGRGPVVTPPPPERKGNVRFGFSFNIGFWLIVFLALAWWAGYSAAAGFGSWGCSP